MAAKKRKPNILMLGVDSLWADHMSCYGYHRQTTPHIDALARRGTRFARNYSPHIPTTPAYNGMISGCDVFSTQIVALSNKTPLPEDVPSLPEILRKEGYTSSVIGFDGNKRNNLIDLPEFRLHIFRDPSSSEEPWKWFAGEIPITRREYEDFQKRRPHNWDPKADRVDAYAETHIGASNLILGIKGGASPDGFRWKTLPELHPTSICTPS